MEQRMERMHKKFSSDTTHHQKQRRQVRAKTVQRDTKQKYRSENRTAADRTLRAEPLPPPIWHQKIPILRVWYRERDGGTLPARMPKIQRAEGKANKGYRKGETECGKTMDNRR